MPLGDAFLDLFRRLYGEVKPRATPERDLPSADLAERRKAILDEIETTVLPRTLTFKISATAVLVVDAAGQRLHRVLNVDGMALDDQMSSIVGVPLGAAKSQEHSIVAGLITQFSQQDGPLTVLSAPELDDHDPTCVGVTPGDLAVEKATPAQPAPKPKKPVAQKNPARASKTQKPKAKPGKTSVAETPSRAKERASSTDSQLFDAVAELSVIAHLVDRDGAVIRSGGTDPKATLLGAIGDVVTDARSWIEAVQPSIGDDTMLIARSKDLDGLGICLMADGDCVIVAAFANKQFARLISVKRGAA